MKKRLLAFTHGAQDPAGRFRIGQYLPYLERAGWQVSLRPRRPAQPWITPFQHRLLQAGYCRAGLHIRRWNRLHDIKQASRFDAVFLNRDLLEGKFEYEELLFRKNARVVFDFDDAIFLGQKANHIGRICKQAAWVIAGNEYLASFAREHTMRVSVIPTVIDTSLYPARPHPPTNSLGPVRVGWLGSSQSIADTLFPYLELLAKLQCELQFEFVVISKPRPVFPQTTLRWQFVEWSPQVETQIVSHFDIGIMPLVDNPFQRGKCGCKLLQYMAAFLPVVASPVGINPEITGNGTRGFAATTEAEWRAALATLIQDAARRQRMGLAGREFVELHYSLQRWFPELLSVIERV